MAIALIPAPHIGKMLKDHIKTNRLYRSALARDLGKDYDTVGSYFKRPSVQVHILFNVSQALNYNFLADIAALLAHLPSAPTAKDQRIAELEKQVAELKAERDSLQQVVEILKQR